MLQRYIMNKSATTSGSSLRTLTDGQGLYKEDAEKGSDIEIIDWVENDPEA